MSEVEWFAEPRNPQSNWNVGEYLISLGADSRHEYQGIEDTEGKRHDCWLLMPGVITRLLEATRTDTDKVKHMFRFFKREAPEKKIRPADFFRELQRDPEIVRIRGAIAKKKEKSSRSGR